MLIEFSRHLFMHSSPKVPSQQLYNTLVYRRVHGQLNDCKVLRPCGWKNKPFHHHAWYMRCLRWYGVLSSTWLLYTYYSMPVETVSFQCVMVWDLWKRTFSKHDCGKNDAAAWHMYHVKRKNTKMSVTWIKMCLFFLPVIDIQAFERLLGPCIDIMKRNISQYEDQLVALFGSSDDLKQ